MKILLLFVILAGSIKFYAQTSESYFPLEIGNKWYYSSYEHGDQVDFSKIDCISEVKSIRELMQKKFYLMETTYYNTNNSIRIIDSSYYCMTSDTLLKIDSGQPFNESSVCVYAVFSSRRFSGSLYADSLEERITETKDFSCKAYAAMLREKTNSTITFAYYIPHTEDFGHVITFKKNVGIIKGSALWGNNSELVKYELK
ncbi:MAG TPA: hypothetical protein VLB84_08290 [Bacteroidia bacterium]|nr:hypothetical protein [Bacteroidia bacterium]